MEKPIYLDGHKYVLVDRLPSDQLMAFSKYISKEGLLTCQDDDMVIKNCAPYADYMFWYQHHFNSVWTQETAF